MRMLVRQSPSLFERVLGRRRANRLRRRLGFMAFGAGVVLLKPVAVRAALVAVGLVVAAAIVLT